MRGQAVPIGPSKPPTTSPTTSGEQGSTLLTDMPTDATLDLWLKPMGSSIIPTRVASEHISDLVAQGETVLLVSFFDVMSDISTMMANAFARGKQLDVPVLMLIGSGAQNFLSAAIYWSRGGANLHRREEVRGREVVFNPSKTLLQLLGIGRKGTIKTRNSLTLIHNHRIVANWVDACDHGMDDSSKMMPTPHDWTTIEAAMVSINGN